MLFCVPFFRSHRGFHLWSPTSGLLQWLPRRHSQCVSKYKKTQLLLLAGASFPTPFHLELLRNSPPTCGFLQARVCRTTAAKEGEPCSLTTSKGRLKGGREGRRVAPPTTQAWNICRLLDRHHCTDRVLRRLAHVQ